MKIIVTVHSNASESVSLKFYIRNRRKKAHEKSLMETNDRLSIVNPSPSKNRKVVLAESPNNSKGFVKYKTYGFLSIFREKLLTFECDHLVLYKYTSKEAIGTLKSETSIKISMKNALVNIADDTTNTIYVTTYHQNQAKKHVLQSENASSLISEIRDYIQLASTDYFTELPEEMVLTVFSYLERPELSRCNQVCKRFDECLSRDSFWKSWFYTCNDKNIIEERDLQYLKVNWKWISRCRPIEPAKSAGFSGMAIIGACYGEFLNGKPHGLCVTLFDNAKYVGECKNGLKDGKGYLLFSKGEKIEGEFKDGKLISGTITRLNGNTYEGEFKNSKYDGKGILTKANGKKYVGEFKNGSRNGKGVFSFPDGSRYEGDFKNGRYDGYGIYLNVKGSKYEGDFKNGKYEGKGIYTNTLKGYTYEGDFKNGKFHGIGKLTNHLKGSWYEGEFKYGWSDGIGIYMSYDGSKYEGDFRRGKYHGRGIYERPNGSKYIGEFANGRFDGKGSFVTTTGKKYEGIFTNGRRAHVEEIIDAQSPLLDDVNIDQEDDDDDSSKTL